MVSTDISINLYAIRRAAGLSQARVSELSEISRVTISLIENGHSRNIGLDTMAALGRALEVPTELLVMSAEFVDRLDKVLQSDDWSWDLYQHLLKVQQVKNGPSPHSFRQAMDALREIPELGDPLVRAYCAVGLAHRDALATSILARLAR